ncbi:MAG: XRE family transcriptional regulator [Actinobacteria bacterium]|nr:XRE family transcriptional regulator [Actinomycetota bacterium]
MLLRHALGERLREARTTAGMSIRALSATAGVSVGYLSEIERGHKEVSSEILAAVCRALGVDVSSVVAGAAGAMAAADAAVTFAPVQTLPHIVTTVSAA